MDKICYGQAYIIDDQLIQDTITFTETGQSFNGTNVIIENIWEDLLASSHQYKKSGKKYFYWEYTQTNDEGQDIFIKYEAPTPKENLFGEDLNPNDWEGEYPKYWVSKIVESIKNYEDKAAIQKKEIIFADNKTVNFETGEPQNNSGYTVKNTDTGFIESLLSLF